MSEFGADVVVVGGSAAGIAAAITVRRHYPNKQVLVVRKEAQVLVPCGIPYMIGTIESPDKNLIPDGVLQNNGIGLLLDEVTGIDREARHIVTSGGHAIPYERLVLATGSKPIQLPIPGADRPGVYAILKDVPYLTELKNKIIGAQSLVIIGGGYIGVEMADECKKAGVKDVTIVEIMNRCLMLAYDEEICAEVEKALSKRGLHIASQHKVEAIDGEEGALEVTLEDGSAMPADLVIMAVGTLPEVELAKRANLAIGPTGAIVVDRTMRTSDPVIFACGDCAEKHSFFGGKPSSLKLASIATSEARIAGANLYGTRRENIGTIGVFSTALGDQAFCTAGLTERQARENNYDVVVGMVQSPDRHPGCMPGVHTLKVKLVFERRTRVLLGGQLVGGPGAGELVNALSACIQNRLTADEVATFQVGTHPALTASPIAYGLVNAAEMALSSMHR